MINLLKMQTYKPSTSSNPNIDIQQSIDDRIDNNGTIITVNSINNNNNNNSSSSNIVNEQQDSNSSSNKEESSSNNSGNNHWLIANKRSSKKQQTTLHMHGFRAAEQLKQPTTAVVDLPTYNTIDLSDDQELASQQSNKTNNEKTEARSKHRTHACGIDEAIISNKVTLEYASKLQPGMMYPDPAQCLLVFIVKYCFK